MSDARDLPGSPSLHVPDLAMVASLFRGQEVLPAAFMACFKISTIYAVRPPRPGFMVAAIPRLGRWVRVYSSLDELVEQEGGVNWMGLLGGVALKLVPTGVGMVLDPHREHSVAVPSVTAAPSIADCDPAEGKAEAASGGSRGC